MTRPVSVHALVPAAGSGERMGAAVPKQYLTLAGKTVLAHAIESLTRDSRVAGVTVVLAPGDTGFESARESLGVHVQITEGGGTRAESVLRGLGALPRDEHSRWVLVHDAVRPCLPPECLKRLLDEGLGHPHGALLAVPVRDTLKREGRDRLSVETLERTGLWAAQTPQVYPREALMEALEAMLAAGETPTDEAAAMERAGAFPKLVAGSSANLKITWPEDLEAAEAWLAARAVAE